VTAVTSAQLLASLISDASLRQLNFDLVLDSITVEK
jgi:hypothetical protein